MVKAIICNDADVDRFFTLEARTLAGMDDAAKWSTTFFGEARKVAKTLLASMFKSVAGPVVTQLIKDEHRPAFTSAGGGGARVLRAARATYGRARKLVLDEVGQTKARAEWVNVKRWQDEFKPMSAPGSGANNTHELDVKLSARIDFTS